MDCRAGATRTGARQVYALFYEDDFILIATVEKDSQAAALGRVISRERGRPVIVALNAGDGTTRVCQRFVDGVQVEVRTSPHRH
jgi:hypothetical protein